MFTPRYSIGRTSSQTQLWRRRSGRVERRLSPTERAFGPCLGETEGVLFRRSDDVGHQETVFLCLVQHNSPALHGECSWTAMEQRHHQRSGSAGRKAQLKASLKLKTKEEAASWAYTRRWEHCVKKRFFIFKAVFYTLGGFLYRLLYKIKTVVSIDQMTGGFYWHYLNIYIYIFFFCMLSYSCAWLAYWALHSDHWLTTWKWGSGYHLKCSEAMLEKPAITAYHKFEDKVLHGCHSWGPSFHGPKSNSEKTFSSVSSLLKLSDILDLAIVQCPKERKENDQKCTWCLLLSRSASKSHAESASSFFSSNVHIF